MRTVQRWSPTAIPAPEAPTRHLIVIEFVSFDGVIQAPGGPDEDTSGGFTHGGWIRPYADPVQSAVIP